MKPTIAVLVLTYAAFGQDTPKAQVQDILPPAPGPVIVRFNADQQSAFQSLLLQQDNLRLRTCLSNQIPEEECGQLTMQGVMRMPKAVAPKAETPKPEAKPSATVNQSSTGPNSPNVANVAGDVNLVNGKRKK